MFRSTRPHGRHHHRGRRRARRSRAAPLRNSAEGVHEAHVHVVDVLVVVESCEGSWNPPDSPEEIDSQRLRRRIDSRGGMIGPPSAVRSPFRSASVGTVEYVSYGLRSRCPCSSGRRTCARCPHFRNRDRPAERRAEPLLEVLLLRRRLTVEQTSPVSSDEVSKLWYANRGSDFRAAAAAERARSDAREPASAAKSTRAAWTARTNPPACPPGHRCRARRTARRIHRAEKLIARGDRANRRHRLAGRVRRESGGDIDRRAASPPVRHRAREQNRRPSTRGSETAVAFAVRRALVLSLSSASAGACDCAGRSRYATRRRRRRRRCRRSWRDSRRA